MTTQEQKPKVYPDAVIGEYKMFPDEHTGKYLATEDAMKQTGYSVKGFNANRGLGTTKMLKVMLVRPFPEDYSPEQEQREAQEAFFSNGYSLKMKMLGRNEALASNTGGIIKR